VWCESGQRHALANQIPGSLLTPPREFNLSGASRVGKQRLQAKILLFLGVKNYELKSLWKLELFSVLQMLANVVRIHFQLICDCRAHSPRVPKMRRIGDGPLESDVGDEKLFRTVANGTTPGIIVVIFSGEHPAERLSC
jgi:hypothetical protein